MVARENILPTAGNRKVYQQSTQSHTSDSAGKQVSVDFNEMNEACNLLREDIDRIHKCENRELIA